MTLIIYNKYNNKLYDMMNSKLRQKYNKKCINTMYYSINTQSYLEMLHNIRIKNSK